MGATEGLRVAKRMRRMWGILQQCIADDGEMIRTERIAVSAADHHVLQLPVRAQVFEHGVPAGLRDTEMLILTGRNIHRHLRNESANRRALTSRGETIYSWY